MRKEGYFIAGYITATVLAVTLGRCGHGADAAVGDTVRVVTHDTVREVRPQAVDSVTVRVDTVRVPPQAEPPKLTMSRHRRNPQINNVPPQAEAPGQPTSVTVPITQKRYEGVGYRAWVSGWHPSLDSIWIDREHETLTVIKAGKPHRWGLSISAGAALTPRGFEPYVGVGVSYTLITF